MEQMGNKRKVFLLFCCRLKNSFVLLQPVSEEKGVRGSKEREKNKQ